MENKVYPTIKNSILLCIYIHLFNNILCTVFLRFKNIIPIKGFNLHGIMSVEFQPLWFDLIGLVIFIFGIILLKRGFKKAKTST